MVWLVLAVFQSNAYLQQLPFRNYTVKDGLTRDGVRAIYQDSKSWLWVATADGVDRYGGETFMHYTSANGLAADFVNDICEDSSGAIWFATDFAGISSFRNGQFTSYLVVSKSRSSPANKVNQILADGAGRLWLATGGGVYIFEDGRFTRVDAGVTATSIESDDSGTLWIGTTTGLMKVDGNAGHLFLTTVTDHEDVIALARSSDGLLWIGTSSGLRVRATSRGKSVAPSQTELAYKLNGRWIRCILAEANGTIWIGTNSAGIAKVSPTGQLTWITESNVLVGNTVYRVLRDREGNMWFATSRGLSRLISEQIINYSSSDGLSAHEVLSIGQDNFGGMWFGTEHGLSRLRNGRFVTYPLKHERADHYASKIVTDKFRTVWYGTETGLYRIMLRKGFPQLVPCGSESERGTGGRWNSRTNTLYRDDGGNLWFAYDSGVSVLMEGKFLAHPVESATENRVVAAMMRDNLGDLWVGLSNGGILRYRVDTASRHSSWLQLKERIGNVSGMRDDNIRCGLKTRLGELWFGTRFGGVIRLQLKDGEVGAVKSFTTEEGLASNWVNDMIQDSRGNIWLATSRGINRLEFADDSREDIVVRTIAIDDGLAGDGANCVYEDDHGILWFGTNGGLRGMTGLWRIRR